MIELIKGEYVLEVEVEDEGIGLTPEEAKNIFMPFNQSKNRGTMMQYGNGVGLSICKQIC